MNRKFIRFFWGGTLVVLLFIQACSPTPVITLPASQSNTPGPTGTSTITRSLPTITPISLTATPTILPSSTPSPITHSNKPGNPAPSGYLIIDSNSSLTASLNRPQGGDYFDRNFFERPFSPDTQDTYYPQIDIQQTSIQNSTPWVYANITVKSPATTSKNLDGSYAIELDLNKDGRGDVLIVVNQPQGTDWSVTGVQVWTDPDHDVGGNTPVLAENNPQGDGYEKLLFDQGKGNDPDLAWARIDSNKPQTIWFAFKVSLLQNATQYMWGAWAQMGGLHPELFDYNDHLTEAQAGDPINGMPYYPLKGLAEVDNTCRGSVGFKPVGYEPGLCPFPPTPTPAPSATKNPATPSPVPTT